MEKQDLSTKNKKPVIGITMGDINGIGPEVIIKSLADSRILKYLTPVIYGSTKILSYYRKNLAMDDFNYTQVKDGFINFKKVNVVNCWEEVIEINAGSIDPETGKYAFISLEKATEDLMNEKIDALVTGPVNKKLIQRDTFNFAGQTEYITAKVQQGESMMMMVSDLLKVGLVTNHLPISEVASSITPEIISSKIKIFLKSLKNDFGISKPRIAVLGLNPHAGEDGLLGKEEKEIILPMIEEFRNKGYLVQGPYPSDGFFGVAQYRTFDGVIAMYHDQGLIPFKTMFFDEGVNFTAGLNVIRTSPDHGTAYNLAGKNVASEVPMRSAIFLAKEIYYHRNPVLRED
ncbi:MAG: 4-hydroxythreonine-4-phosphate dehydrogenase PdxA [Cyclobacteriaceae bacterium]|nr:4-hydroxythreonine-4-phosphate dehydrogenase PdxA [Cyclobacteriaceae bacterium]